MCLHGFSYASRASLFFNLCRLRQLTALKYLEVSVHSYQLPLFFTSPCILLYLLTPYFLLLTAFSEGRLLQMVQHILPRKPGG